MTVRGQYGGSLFTTPFSPGTYQESTGDDAINYDHLLGNLYEGPQGEVLQLVKTHASAFAWRYKTAVWSDDGNYVVTPCVSASQIVAGVGDNLLGTAESVPASAYMFVQVGGRAEVQLGDDHAGAPAVDGEYLVTDDDADTGKVKGGGAVFTFGKTFARAMEASAGNDQVLSCQLLILQGAA